MPVFLHDERADRLHGDQGRTGSTSAARSPTRPTRSTSSRRARSSRASSSTRRGELVDDIYRMAVANSRVPKMVAGDINAEVVGRPHRRRARSLRLVERYGLEAFCESVERMFDHGEAVVRSYFEQIPGRPLRRPAARWTTTGSRRRRVPFEVVRRGRRLDRAARLLATPRTRIRGRSTARSPSTVSASRIAITMLAGGGEAPNEGHFRPIEVVARPGLDVPPAARRRRASSTAGRRCRRSRPIYNAVAEAMPGGGAARASGGDICCARLVGRPRGDAASLGRTASPHPVGQGALDPRRRRELACIHHAEAATRFSPTRGVGVEEPVAAGAACELAPDSCGPGRHRGGLGARHALPHARGLATSTSAIERTKNAPWGLEGGGEARPNGVELRLADGTRARVRQGDAAARPEGRRRSSSTRGGGGGYGPPAERDAEAVRRDMREGYITEEHARRHYPHAFEVSAAVQPKSEPPASEGAPADDVVLSVRDLHTHFLTRQAPVQAVRGVSFDLRRAEKLGIVGESGSGSPRLRSRSSA